MVDKSWGLPPIRPAMPVADVPARSDRSQRMEERLRAAEERSQGRVASREQAAQERERAREARRVEEEARRQERGDAIGQRPRRSGRKDVVREQRDTRSYSVVKDEQRIRELAKRGASVAGLAGAFGITVEEVEAVLAE